MIGDSIRIPRDCFRGTKARIIGKVCSQAGFFKKFSRSSHCHGLTQANLAPRERKEPGSRRTAPRN